jgi:hypothetical protein
VAKVGRCALAVMAVALEMEQNYVDKLNYTVFFTQIKEVNETGLKFFQQPKEVKFRYRLQHDDIFGWIASEQESYGQQSSTYSLVNVSFNILTNNLVNIIQALYRAHQI